MIAWLIIWTFQVIHVDLGHMNEGILETHKEKRKSDKQKNKTLVKGWALRFEGELKKSTTEALRTIILDNACIIFIIAADDTKLVHAYSPYTVITSSSKKRSLRHVGLPTSMLYCSLRLSPIAKNCTLLLTKIKFFFLLVILTKTVFHFAHNNLTSCTCKGKKKKTLDIPSLVTLPTFTFHVKLTFPFCPKQTSIRAFNPNSINLILSSLVSSHHFCFTLFQISCSLSLSLLLCLGSLLRFHGIGFGSSVFLHHFSHIVSSFLAQKIFRAPRRFHHLITWSFAIFFDQLSFAEGLTKR